MALPSVYRSVVKTLSQSWDSIARKVSAQHVGHLSCRTPHPWQLSSVYQFQPRRMCTWGKLDIESVEAPSPRSIEPARRGSIESQRDSPVWKGPRCYRCGESGHIARECHQDKSCYKCGKTGHLSNDCQSVARREEPKNCYNCGEEGHLRSDCPLPNLRDTGPKGVVVVDAVSGASIVCFNCGKGGHIARNCQQEKSCYNCKQKGHLASDCPEEQRCGNCGQEGHFRSACPDGKRCFHCGQPGHLARECDQKIKALEIVN